MLLVDYADFNTSNVTIQPYRLNLSTSATSNFNTSNVTIQRTLNNGFSIIVIISIHLMLLFNEEKTVEDLLLDRFQYI